MCFADALGRTANPRSVFCPSAGFFQHVCLSSFPSPQIPLRPALPNIYGPVEYRDEGDLYERIDGLLHSTGIEGEYIAAAFAQSGRDWATATSAAIDRFGLYATIGLRCAVARSLTGLSLRGLTTRAADSTTLAWFLGTADIERVQSPSKSTEQDWSFSHSRAERHR